MKKGPLQATMEGGRRKKQNKRSEHFAFMQEGSGKEWQEGGNGIGKGNEMQTEQMEDCNEHHRPGGLQQWCKEKKDIPKKKGRISLGKEERPGVGDDVRKKNFCKSWKKEDPKKKTEL